MDRTAQLPDALLPWYRENHRDLPWRRDRDPYHIWVSEIMLQQTRVEAVKGYYTRFLTALPSIAALAGCDDDALHKLWEGLGYYSRVRNLKKAAQVIMDHHRGVFPDSYEAVRALPGIGAYTAGAICSICFGLPTPAVDGNVLRVMARLTDNDTPIDLPARKKEVTAQLAAVYPEAAGDFTQALMELGATICGPNRKPDCDNCPCKNFCLGFQRGTAQSLPVKLPKKQKKEEYLTVFILTCGDQVALSRRPDTGLLASLWEFPNVPGTLDHTQALEYQEQLGLHPTALHRVVKKKHIFTHIQWNMTGIYLEVAEPGGPWHWFSREEIEERSALPTAFRQFWEETDNV